MAHLLLRTASAERVSLQHPAPGLESLQGAYLKNVERLEQSAEELSQGGSDIGEEIRRMKHEQDRASRRSSSVASREGRRSIASLEGRQRQHSTSASAAASASASAVLSSTRSRNHSTSSYANSIVDVNTAARWGGYSPGGYITSPTVSRVSSFHRPSGMPEPVQEGRPLDSPLVSPTSMTSQNRFPSHHSLAPTNGEPLDVIHDKTPEPHHDDWERVSNRSDPDAESRYSQSVRHPYDDEEEFEHVQPQRPQVYAHHHSYHGMPHDHDDPYRPATPPERPQTADTYRQARSLFKDFDGVHYSPAAQDIIEDEDEELPATPQAVPRAPRPTSHARNSVYYPAPVPRMLNLPKRLSQLPPASPHAKRRSQLSLAMPAEAPQSAPWLPALDFEQSGDDQHQQPQPSQRPSPLKQRRSMMDPPMNRMSMANLPPQLRASAYFEHHSAAQTDVKIQSASAVATLDSILAASVNAPVDVFVDHPFAGSVGRDVYKSEPPKKRRSAAVANARASNTDLASDYTQKGHDRSASSGTAGSRPTMQKRQSVLSMITDFGRSEGKRLKKKNSKMSPTTDLDVTETRDSAAAPSQSRRQSLNNLDDMGQTTEGAGHAEDSAIEHEEPEEDFDDEGSEEADPQDMIMPFVAQPATLLAELQTRKAHQKSRNRTAANSFPNGMHSTLMQLDAVAQIEKRKRQDKRTRLAWEDPDMAEAELQREEADEDVPLGVLYPATQGLIAKSKTSKSDWDQPLGLMEKRELEDNEPLSNRRFRLKGLSYAEVSRMREEQERLRREAQLPPPEAVPLPGEEDEAVDPNEPLAQRLRRIKQKEALTSALGDVGRRESAFSEELLSTLGGLDIGTKDKAATAKLNVIEPAEETLGQRRARLQREREQQQMQNSPKQRDSSDPPSLRTIRPTLQPSPSLANLLAANPIGSGKPRASDAMIPGTMLAENAKAEDEAKRKLRDSNAARNSAFNHLNGGSRMAPNFVPPGSPGYAGQQPVMYPAHMIAGGGMAPQYPYNPYMQNPYAGMGYAYNGAAQQPVPANTATYASMAQWQPHAGMPDPSMNSTQRDLIDRWRSSIAQGL